MKKTYIRPAAQALRLMPEALLAASGNNALSTDGSASTDLTVGDEEYDGTFRSASRGWGDGE